MTACATAYTTTCKSAEGRASKRSKHAASKTDEEEFGLADKDEDEEDDNTDARYCDDRDSTVESKVGATAESDECFDTEESRNRANIAVESMVKACMLLLPLPRCHRHLEQLVLT
eukprot:6198567-Pleurochrysis_carterae.AAC.1